MIRFRYVVLALLFFSPVFANEEVPLKGLGYLDPEGCAFSKKAFTGSTVDC